MSARRRKLSKRLSVEAAHRRTSCVWHRCKNSSRAVRSVSILARPASIQTEEASGLADTDRMTRICSSRCEMIGWEQHGRLTDLLWYETARLFLPLRLGLRVKEIDRLNPDSKCRPQLYTCALLVETKL